MNQDGRDNQDLATNMAASGGAALVAAAAPAGKALDAVTTSFTNAFVGWVLSAVLFSTSFAAAYYIDVIAALDWGLFAYLVHAVVVLLATNFVVLGAMILSRLDWEQWRVIPGYCGIASIITVFAMSFFLKPVVLDVISTTGKSSPANKYFYYALLALLVYVIYRIYLYVANRLYAKVIAADNKKLTHGINLLFCPPWVVLALGIMAAIVNGLALEYGWTEESYTTTYLNSIQKTLRSF